MDQETKLELLKKIIYISGAFCILVAILLILNFWHMKHNKPLESQTIEALVKRLADDKQNEALRKEIRNFDLLARKAYFTSEWQVNTGAYMLLAGAIILVMALKIRTDLQRKISLPESSPEDPVMNRIISHWWLLVTGALLFALALFSAFLSTDYLKNYYPGQFNNATLSDQKENIEVIQIVESSASEKQDSVPTGNKVAVAVLNDTSYMKTAQGNKTPVSNFTIDDFKKNQSCFRGYLGHGISYHKNIPTDWDGSTGQNIKWKVAVTKPGFNSPVIWGNKIFIAGGDQSSRVVSCYNRNTGRLLWEKMADNIPGSPILPPKTTEDTGLSAPTMAVDGNRVYALFTTGDIIAFDLDGNRLWAKNLGVPANHYGHSSSLIVWNGILIVQYDTSKGGRMMAMNTANGEFVWDITRDNKISWSSPILLESKGKMQIITSADPNVAGYDLETGNEIWKTAVMSGEVAPSPAAFNGIIFATNEYAKTVAVYSDEGGKIIWETDEYLSEVSSPVAYNGLLFLATSYGVLVCYDALAGDKIWEKQFEKGFYSSPMIAENKVYIIDMDGVMHILKADNTGTIISEPKLGEAVFALPVFAEGRLYLRGKNSLFCIGE